jgi:hypothetical protein
MVAAARPKRTVRVRGVAPPPPGNAGAGPSSTRPSNATGGSGTSGHRPAKTTSGVVSIPMKQQRGRKPVTKEMRAHRARILRERGRGTYKKMVNTLTEAEMVRIVEACSKNGNACPISPEERRNFIRRKLISNKAATQNAMIDAISALQRGGQAEMNCQAAGGPPQIDPNLSQQNISDILKGGMNAMRSVDPRNSVFRGHVDLAAADLLKIGMEMYGVPMTTVKGALEMIGYGVGGAKNLSKWFCNFFEQVTTRNSRSSVNKMSKRFIVAAPLVVGGLGADNWVAILAILGIGFANEAHHHTPEVSAAWKETPIKYIGGLVVRYSVALSVAFGLMYMKIHSLFGAAKYAGSGTRRLWAAGLRAWGSATHGGAAGFEGFAAFMDWFVETAPVAARAASRTVRIAAEHSGRTMASWRTSTLGLHDKRKYFTRNFWNRDGTLSVHGLAMGITKIVAYRLRYYLENPDRYTSMALAASVLVMLSILYRITRKAVRGVKRASAGVYDAVRSRKRTRNSNVANASGRR